MDPERSIQLAQSFFIGHRRRGKIPRVAFQRLISAGFVSTVCCSVLLGAYSAHSAMRNLGDRAEFPLQACDTDISEKCVATLFFRNATIPRRDPDDFPPHYLELADPTIRSADCANRDGSCKSRLESISDYFNPNDTRPKPGDLGVALEGGGTKAAPFALGTLAGLQELGLLGTRVQAISSISGGSYAASYYFNRLYDQLRPDAIDAGNADDWFRSCIPDYFINKPNFAVLRDQASPQRCWEKTNDVDLLQRQGVIKRYNEFAREYEFLGHVWKNHDLLQGITPGNLHTHDDLLLPEYGNVALLGTETIVTIPFQFIARTVFRWPLNSSPSKLAYKLGLEREYGYTPHDWANAGSSYRSHLVETMTERRKTRTLSIFRKLEAAHAPLWIIGTTAPGAISGVQWLSPSPRDPLRQQFELTWAGYGSGTYGYARQSPDAPFDFLGRNPDGMPVLDAVVASAAFFDDDETQISRQPFRLLAGAGQHFGNVTWFSEVRNFNVGDGSREIAKVLPWPAYLATTSAGRQSPYIHLQDGGNAENTGIFPLLRRGYKTIIYAHGTQDDKAEWAAMCHLKNQLELDGAYFIRSPDLEGIVAPRSVGTRTTKGRAFASYFDALCSSQLDGSDLATFDNNPMRAHDEAIPAVAKLYCGRLGDPVERRTSPDPHYVPCDEFVAKFGAPAATDTKPPPAPAAVIDLFYQWPVDTPLVFKIYRGDTLDNLHREPQEKDLLSTIIAIVPAIAWSDVKAQLIPPTDLSAPVDWEGWYSLDKTQRRNWQIGYCYGPDDRLLVASNDTATPGKGLPCTALAHVLEDDSTGRKGQRRPEFPQDDFVMQTLHTTYTSFAAYFDLARYQVRNAVCTHWPSEAGPVPVKCSAQGVNPG